MKKLNNKGLSLVELVLAIGMSTIVIGAATMFLYNAERSYRIAEYAVDLQMEAQILMEQMSNWVLESNRIEVQDDSSDASILVLYTIPRTKKDYNLNDVTLPATRRVVFVKDKKLYIIEDEESSEEDGIPIGTFAAEAKNRSFVFDDLRETTDEDIIGEYVNVFTVSIPYGVDADNIQSVDIKVGLHEGSDKQGQSYTVNNTFGVRNGLITIEKSPTPTAVPDDDDD